jgi:hypothetical protein
LRPWSHNLLAGAHGAGLFGRAVGHNRLKLKVTKAKSAVATPRARMPMAPCTPDFFGYDAARKLKYRGRLDEGRTTPPPVGARRELVEAMRQIATAGQGSAEKLSPIGCSIKWKAG